MEVRVIEFPEYDVVVPFVCHRCGNCCRKYYPGIEMDMLPEIARLLERPVQEIQARLSVDCDAHNAGTPVDCFFLEPGGNRCLIHAIRPDGCRLFPTLTETGLGKVDCPGQKEFRRVEKALLLRGKHARVRKATHLRQPRRIPDSEWPGMLLVLKKAEASDMLVGQFVLMNKL